MFYIQYTSSAASQGQIVAKYIIGFLFNIIQQHKTKIFCRKNTHKKFYFPGIKFFFKKSPKIRIFKYNPEAKPFRKYLTKNIMR